MKKFVAKILSKLSERQKYYFSSLFLILITSILAVYILELSLYSFSFKQVYSFISENTLAFYYNVLLTFLIFTFIWALVNKPIRATNISLVITIIFAYINFEKEKYRDYPLLPDDFQLATNINSILEFINPWSVALLIFFLIALSIGFKYTDKKFAKKLHLSVPKYTKKSHKLQLMNRAAILALSFFAFLSLSEFARHSKGEKFEDTFLHTQFAAWNQQSTYRDNGFLIGFLYNLQKLKVQAPDEYSAEYIAEVKQKYTLEADQNNETRSSILDDEASIIIILNESFYDPSVKYNGEAFSTYVPYEGGDVTPNLHKIQQKYPHGYTYSLDYGGGTANIEFETLTSLSNFWLETVPYTNLIPKTTKTPSIASVLKNQGYETLAIHPYNGGMYKRNISLKKEGFDTFITAKEMHYREKDGKSEYINDKSAYNETLDALKSTDKKQIISLVTMQNHTPYNNDNYEELKFTVTDETLKDEERKKIETYFQTLYNSDKYLGEFIEELDKLEKNVVVLFYGDHSAGIFPQTNDNERKEVRELSRLTPYFIYTNYKTDLKNTKLATTTPNCLINTLFDTMNWQKSARYYLAASACKEEPILSGAHLEGKSLDYSEALKEYRIVTYDIIGGKNYWNE